MTGLLKGIVILDLADEQGSFCSKLLADLGATVIKPEGGPSRSECPFSFFYENRNKLEGPVGFHSPGGKQEFRSLIRKADVLVETSRPGGLESLGFGRPRLRRLNPRLIHLSITPFGRSGPRHDYHSSDAVVSAFGGQMYVCGRRPGPPVRLFGPQACYTASLFGAVAVLIRLKKRKITGKGSYFDLSIQEAVASTLDRVMIDYFHGGKIAGRGENGNGEGFAVLPSCDGYVLITILRDWETLLELLDSEGKAGDLAEKEWEDPGYRESRLDHIRAIVGEWTRCHTKRELLELGQAMRFPWASIDSIDEVLKNPQLGSREFFVKAPFSEGGPAVAIPGPPYRFSSPWPAVSAGVPPPQDADARCPDEKIFRGLRVLDLTRMLSGPYATRILADFGAEVIKVQSKVTARGAERNDSAYFSAWNRNKRSITLDLDLPDARKTFLKLAATADVVVENFAPRVMENWGLDYDRLKEVNPDLVMVSISAMGHTGPWKDFVGYAPTFHALSGLVSATSGNPGPPVSINHGYGDVIAGLYAALAILSAIEYRDKTGQGRHVDLSALEAVCTLLGPAFVESQIDSGFVQSGIRNQESGIYRCTGEDRWSVISVMDQEQRQRLRRIAGCELIEQWTAGQTPEAVVQRLQAAGIAAGVVQNAEDLAKDPQLAARRFFVSLDHPALGKVVSDRSALWDWRRKPGHWKASPLLGEDNDVYL